MTAKYRLPSYSSYNEICLGRVNIATARGKLRRQAGSKMAYGSNSCGSELCRYSWGFRQEALKRRAADSADLGSLGMRHEECVGRTSFANNRHKFGAATN